MNSDNQILDNAETKSIIEYIRSHVFQEKYIYTHNWKPNDLIIWHNKCVLHKVNFEFDNSKPRWMERIVIRGEITGKFVPQN